MRFFGILALIGIIGITYANTLSELSVISQGLSQTDEPDNGKIIYLKKCKRCHGLIGEKVKNKIPELRLSKLSLDQIVKQVSFGKNTMPQFQFKLTGEEILQVSHYTFNEIIKK